MKYQRRNVSREFAHKIIFKGQTSFLNDEWRHVGYNPRGGYIYHNKLTGELMASGDNVYNYTKRIP